MRSIERRFRQIEEENPFLSSMSCFIKTIAYQGFGDRTINAWFERLVEKDDYAGTVKKELMAYLREIGSRVSPDESEGAGVVAKNKTFSRV